MAAGRVVAMRTDAAQEALLADMDERPNAALHWLVGQLTLLLPQEVERIGLSRDEWRAVADAGNGLYMGPDDPTAVRLLWAEVADACRLDGLAERHGIDGAALVERLRALSPLQSLVVAAAIKTFWRHANDDAALARGWCGRAFAAPAGAGEEAR